MILHSMCNCVFGYGISCVGFPNFLASVLDRRNHLTYFLLLASISNVINCIRIVARLFSCNIFLPPADWRSSFKNNSSVLYYVLSVYFFSRDSIAINMVGSTDPA